EAVVKWLRQGVDRAMDDGGGDSNSVETPAKKQRLEEIEKRLEESQPATSEVLGVVAVGRPSYAWFKEVVSAGTDYRACRSHFHSADPFCHWRRKHTLAFDDKPDGVDGFTVNLPIGLAAASDSLPSVALKLAR
ncbi:unnamed protein product, partial [Polarella glacialis]